MRNSLRAGKAALVGVVAVIFLLVPGALAETTPHDHSVELTATVSDSPAQITLQWQPDANASSYRLYRKILGEETWREMTAIGSRFTSWTDGSVSVGLPYEYQVIKTTALGYTGYGYICSAVRRNPVEDRGKMILLVEQSLAAALPAELARLQQDLVGDGWTVLRRDIPKSAKPPEVKDLIRSLYHADPAGTKSLFLFGNIAVPFSGKISPDMHENDLGAWPADVYYADMEGQWTDTTVNWEQGLVTGRSNFPGDGRFDQDEPPGEVRIAMGRVDLSNLTCYANKTPARFEVDLARQYLAKDHKFRHGLFDVQRRAMIFDRMHRGMEREPQTCAAWRSFPSFFGRENVRVIGEWEYFPILANESYMWSYVVSGGSFYGSDYIGTSDDWALNNPKVVFTSFLGSWFGQWDRESDFLRAPLGSGGFTLACIYSGQPQWILHPMAMGEPIGYSAMLTQNNKTNTGVYPPQINAGFGQVHIALMGDPSLRMHSVKPPGPVSGNANANGVNLSWGRSPDPEVTGYYVYKASSEAGPFARISGNNAVTGATFSDPAGTAQSVYMVRALKLEQTPAGSYYNLSQGVFYPDSLGASAIPEAPRNVAVSSISQGGVTLSWFSPSVNVLTFVIERRTLPDGAFAKIAEVAGVESSFTDKNLSAGIYAYRVKALGFAGESAFSGEATINLQPSWGSIIGTDTTTGGNWIGRYGDDGYVVIGAATNLPSYVQLTTDNVFFNVVSWNTTAPETLLRPDGTSRLQAFWGQNHHTPMTLSFRFNDSTARRVSLYMCDYNNGARSGTLELIDPFSGRVLASSYFTNFAKGKYITLDLRNFVDVRLTSEYEFRYTVFVNGIFFSTPPLSTDTDTSVEFSSIDTATQGDWQKRFGANGKSVPNWTSNLPAEMEVSSGAQSWTWSDTTTDIRAINKYAPDNTRIASAWYDPNELAFDVSIASTVPRQLALYFLDWDRAGRVQDLTITDPTGMVLLQQRIQNFGDGQYLALKAKGKFRISLRRVAGPNAALNGMFVDSLNLPPPPPPAPALGGLTYNAANNSYTIRVTGQPGQRVKVVTSADMKTWWTLSEVTLSGSSIDYPIPYRSDLPVRIFRALVEP